MDLDIVRSPCAFLAGMISPTAYDGVLREWESYWEKEGRAISEAVDRADTPWVRIFDAAGKRVDEILYAPEYWRLLKKGYRSGVLWRASEDNSLLPSFLLIYLTSFYDCGLTCPYSVSLSTALPLSKYGHPALQQRSLTSFSARTIRCGRAQRG